VLGQLRALGTKQHLKSKFGSGYELTIKYRTHHHHSHAASASVPLSVLATPGEEDAEGEESAPEKQPLAPATTPVTAAAGPSVAAGEGIAQFVSSKFPSSKFISDNGGLMTFTIPSEDMKIGFAFDEIESHKGALLIEDYSIAQSTLEQVFIRTVQAHTPQQDQKRDALLSSTSRQRYDDILGEGGGGGEGHNNELLSEADEVLGVYRDAMNSCGCTVKFTKYSSWISCSLFLLFFILSLALQVSVLIFFAIIFLISFVICCMLCTCPCCQPPKDDDE
jgi:hypothetical protein